MSAIGDYVHYYAENYQAYGSGKAGHEIHKWISPRDTMKARLRANQVANSESFKEMEDALLAIQDPMNQSTQNYRDAINASVRESFTNKIESIDLGSMTVQTTSNPNKGVKTVHAQRSGGHLTFDIKTLTNQVNNLEQIMKTIIEDEPLKSDDLMNLISYKNKIKNLYKKVCGQSYSTIKANGYKINGSTTIPTSEDIRELRRLMNEAIDLYAKYPAISLYEGTVWEDTLAVLGYVAQGTAYTDINDAIKQNVKGGGNVQVAINTEAFGTNPMIKNNFMNKVHISATGEISRRSKVDVQFQWNNEDIKISAKNIAINNKWSWVTVVSGSPLLVMIAGMDSNFVNHYLNLYSLHGGLDPEQKNVKLSNNEKIGDEMRLSLFYEALTGDNYTSQVDSANVFAINDKVHRRFRLIPIGQIIEDLENKMQGISVDINNIALKKYYFENKWARTPEERISNLINELHQAKIHAAFNVGATSLFK